MFVGRMASEKELAAVGLVNLLSTIISTSMIVAQMQVFQAFASSTFNCRLHVLCGESLGRQQWLTTFTFIAISIILW